MHFRQVAILVCLCWSLTNTAIADLYTGLALSIEWLVDSSDAIVEVHIEGDVDESSPTQIVIGKTHKLVGSVETNRIPELLRVEYRKPDFALLLNDQQTERWTFITETPDSVTDLLLFLRNDDQKLSLAQAINLSRPTYTSRTAAISAKGEIIATADDIRKHVAARMEKSHQLDEQCNRSIIDHWGKSHLGVPKWYEVNRQNVFFLTSELIAEILGGFPISVDVDYWDSPQAEDRDEDLILTSVIVPAEEQYRQELVARIERSEHPDESDLIALLNFIDNDTEDLLERVSKTQSRSQIAARQLLYYVRYRYDPTHELDERLLGKWIIAGRNEKVNLDLKQDHSCTINVGPTEITKDNSYYRPTTGKGFWAIHDGKLWIARSHVRRRDKWSRAFREFFSPKKMLRIEPNRIVLENGPPMYRE